MVSPPPLFHFSSVLPSANNYRAVEGLYHLHCLNLLRQSLYFNYAYYSSRGRKPFGDPPDLLKVHVTQCLDILRQQLMCTVDIGIMGQIWYVFYILYHSFPPPLPPLPIFKISM